LVKDKDEGTTLLTYTGLRGGLEHLKKETRLIDERFVSVMGELTWRGEKKNRKKFLTRV
jgi:hypothetical protein